MAETNTAVVGGDVKGDITSCKIENQLQTVQRNSAFSLQQTSSYITYDVCNKKVLASYKVPEFTGFGVILGLVIGGTILLFAMGWSMDW